MQCISNKICWLMFKCLKGLAPAYLSDLCVGTTAVPGRSGLRAVVRGDLFVPGHRREWGSRSFAVTGSKRWNKLPVGRRDLSVGPETFAKHLKTHFFKADFSDKARTSEFLSHFVGCADLGVDSAKST